MLFLVTPFLIAVYEYISTNGEMNGSKIRSFQRVIDLGLVCLRVFWGQVVALLMKRTVMMLVVLTTVLLQMPRMLLPCPLVVRMSERLRRVCLLGGLGGNEVG